MNELIRAFWASLADSERALAEAQHCEQESDYDADASMDRAYEEGFVDALRHVIHLGIMPNPPIDAAQCPHDAFSTTAHECSLDGHAEHAENTCDNCNAVVSRECEEVK